MSKTEKYNLYKTAFHLVNEATKKKSLPNLVAAIAILESIIADRCKSYLAYFDKDFFTTNRWIPTSNLVKRCEKHFPYETISITRRSGDTFSSTKLFEDCQAWLKKRNTILHGFTKSRIFNEDNTVERFIDHANETANEGYQIASLIIKWHKRQLIISKKTNI